VSGLGAVPDRIASPTQAWNSWRPSRREAWLSVGLVFAVALLVRLWAAAQVPFPIPEDTTYYWGVARNLAEGQGLVSATIWSYATAARDPVTGVFGFFFPRPAFEIWLPLPSLLGVLPMLATGSTAYPVTTIVPALLGAFVPVLAWRIAADLAEERALAPGRARTLALGAGLVAAAWLPLVLPSALLDSTIAFGLPALIACVLMVRMARRPPERVLDRRLLGLGILIGVAGLARNEAVWVGLAWALVAWAALRGRGLGGVVRAVAMPAVIAVAVMAPWLVRNWLVFGNPLPGQAVTNAFSLTGFDIFAWNDPPTLARYLAAGPQAWVGHRVDGFLHNFLSVLVVPGIPVSVVGLLGLLVAGRARALRPLLLVALLTFWITTLAFPVATTWGTFLHASVPAQVLLLVAAVAGLDAGIARVGRWRGWSRPVAWLGPTFAALGAVLFTALGIPAYGSLAAGTEAQYADVLARIERSGHAVDGARPIIANHPMWVSEVARAPALALPDEPPADVLDLAVTFGAQIVIVDGEHGAWPAILDQDGPGAACFVPVDLGPPVGGGPDPFRVYRVACP
jgi:hypothetical protein